MAEDHDEREHRARGEQRAGDGHEPRRALAVQPGAGQVQEHSAGAEPKSASEIARKAKW
jgi:hypothetical protein